MRFHENSMPSVVVSFQPVVFTRGILRSKESQQEPAFEGNLEQNRTETANTTGFGDTANADEQDKTNFSFSSGVRLSYRYVFRLYLYVVLHLRILARPSKAGIREASGAWHCCLHERSSFAKPLFHFCALYPCRLC